jgi:hypothetical protein
MGCWTLEEVETDLRRGFGDGGHGLSNRRVDGREGVLRETRALAASFGFEMPEVQPRRSDACASQTPGPGVGLPLLALQPRVQRLHRLGAAGDEAGPGAARSDHSRLRPGRVDGEAVPRAGVRPARTLEVPSQAPGPGPPVPRPRPTGGLRRRGRRDVPKRGGKKGSRTAIRTTRRGGGRTNDAVTGPSPTTGRRSAASRAATAAGSGCQSRRTRIGRRWSG